MNGVRGGGEEVEQLGKDWSGPGRAGQVKERQDRRKEFGTVTAG